MDSARRNRLPFGHRGSTPCDGGYCGLVPSIELNTGRDMPTPGLGTWRLSGGGCEEAVRLALDLGYRHLDTAAMYGNEEAVGAGIRR